MMGSLSWNAFSEGRAAFPSRQQIGWGGRIRTFGLLIQSQAPYRLATPQRES